MPKPSNFESIVDTIAESVLRTIAEASNDQPWSNGVYTQYFSSDGNSATGKLRFIDSNGEIAGAVPERSIRNLISDTWARMFKKSKKNLWYGFKLTLHPNGKHEIEYCFDPNCINDPNFVDW